MVAGFGDFHLNPFAYHGNHRTLLASAVCQTELPTLALFFHLFLIWFWFWEGCFYPCCITEETEAQQDEAAAQGYMAG